MNEDRELRILQIIKGLDIGGFNGGSENFGIRLARQLRQEGHQVALCAYFRCNTPIEAGWVDRLKREGIPVVFANPSRRINLRAGYRTLAGYLKENPVHLVHSHFQTGTLTGILLKITGATRCLIRTAHTPLEFGPGSVGWLARRLFVFWVYPFLLDAEVGVSRALVQILDDRFFARLFQKKAVCIHNALSEMQPVPMDSDPFAGFPQNLPGPPWIITMIGILKPLKSFDTAIRAMPRIRKMIPQARLAIVGRGPEEDALRGLAQELGVAEMVWFLGQRADVSAILAKTNLLLQPSVLEALSTVILEAMQCGVAVAAADIPGNRELIEAGANGWLFPAKDARLLAQTVLDAYQNPARGQVFAQEAYRRLEVFSISAVTREYVELYRKYTRSAVS